MCELMWGGGVGYRDGYEQVAREVGHAPAVPKTKMVCVHELHTQRCAEKCMEYHSDHRSGGFYCRGCHNRKRHCEGCQPLREERRCLEKIALAPRLNLEVDVAFRTELDFSGPATKNTTIKSNL